MPRRRQLGFTLIEMLVVIAIMGIILAAGMLALPGLLKSTSLSTATRQVSNTLNLARQYAITHRATTRVVFSYDGTANGNTGTNRAPQYLSYSVMACTGTSPAVWNNWIYIAKWDTLPVGTVFSRDTCGLNGLNSTSLPFSTNTSASTMTVSNAAPLAYIEFGSTGAARTDSSFTLWEGYIDPAANTPSFTTSANAGTISVDSVIGRVRLQRK